jgi:MFS family permease
MRASTTQAVACDEGYDMGSYDEKVTSATAWGDLPWVREVLSVRFAVVVGAFFALCVSPLAVVTQSNSLFVAPITREFGWTRTVFFLGPSIAGIVGAMMFPLLGLLGDRTGIRPILIVGVVLYAAGLFSMALLHGSVAVYVALCIITVVAGVTQTSLLYAKVISSCFAARRGLMLSIAISGIGAGSILIPPFTRNLIARFGWRGAYIGLGTLVLLVALPSVLFLIREPPRAGVKDPDSAHPIAVTDGLSLREATQTRTFWLLITLFAAGNGAFLSLVNNLFPILTSRGIAASSAAAAMSALGASQTLTRLLSGYVLDKTSRAAVASVWYALATGGAVLLCFAHTSYAGITVGLLAGTAWGAENELAAYFTARYFGLRAYGLILGTFFTVFALGGMPGVMLTAHVFDTYGNYNYALIAMAGCLALSSVVAACLGPYQFSKSGSRQA